MQKKIIAGILVGFAVFFAMGMQIPYVYRAVETYTIGKIEQQLGAQSIPAEQEATIRALAQEMGIQDEFLVRKMNDAAMGIMNYHNAFVIQSLLWNVLPLVDKPLVYISAGFFEDMSPAEQRFLIGHELIHLKERHLRFLPLIQWVFVAIAVLVLVKYVFPPLTRLFNRLAAYWAEPVELRYVVEGVRYLSVGMMISACGWMLHFGVLAYRRHIEWQADIESVALLHTYDGGIEFMDRCVKTLGQPARFGYKDMFVDHPSNDARKKYCVAQKNNQNQS